MARPRRLGTPASGASSRRKPRTV